MSDDAKMKNSADNPENEDNELTNFIWDFIDEDIAQVVNITACKCTQDFHRAQWFLHIGHAKALFINLRRRSVMEVL